MLKLAVEVLTPPVRPKEPLPILLTLRVPRTVSLYPRKRPLKVVLALLRPNVSVLAVPELLVISPEPESWLRTWSNAFRSKRLVPAMVKVEA